jgi:hypothetical protein
VVFDGESLRPISPLNLEPQSRYQVTIHEEAPAAGASAWDVLDALSGAMTEPADWSEQHDHYLHGTPKRTVEG